MEFLTQLHTAFALSPGYFVDDRSKILYAVSFFVGNAMNWWQVCLLKTWKLQNLDEYEVGEITSFTNFVNFKKEFKEQFISSRSTIWDAESAILNAKQNSRTVSDYASFFQAKLAEAECEENLLVIRIFYNGLNVDVQRELSMKTRPKTLKEMISSAIDIGNRLTQANTMVNFTNRKPNHTQTLSSKARVKVKIPILLEIQMKSFLAHIRIVRIHQHTLQASASIN